jgi:DNA-binding XRE family transcriptional regulator
MAKYIVMTLQEIDKQIAYLKQLKKLTIEKDKSVKKLSKDYCANFQKGLYKARYMAGYSLSEVAKSVGVTKQTIYKWENSKQIIPIERARQLAKLFSIKF